ncbi:hypothetical protein Y032_0126g1320 [Ancylostoma ceylanicum]|nr:hypothetical protein Y032_0126g1320 [Ancylostoma ceylanicum]
MLIPTSRRKHNSASVATVMANDRSDSEKDDGVSGQENMRSVYLLPKKDLEPRQSQTRSVYLMPAVGVEESAKQTRVRRGSKENDEMYDEDSVHEKRKHKSKKKSKKSGSREDTEGRKSSTPSRDHSRKRVAHKYAKRHDKKPSSSDERDQVSSSKKRDKRKKKGRKRGSKEKPLHFSGSIAPCVAVAGNGGRRPQWMRAGLTVTSDGSDRRSPRLASAQQSSCSYRSIILLFVTSTHKIHLPVSI